MVAAAAVVVCVSGGFGERSADSGLCVWRVCIKFLLFEAVIHPTLFFLLSRDQAISGVQTVRFRNELERNITIKLGYANAKIYKCTNPDCARPSNYTSVFFVVCWCWLRHPCSRRLCVIVCHRA